MVKSKRARVPSAFTHHSCGITFRIMNRIIGDWQESCGVEGRLNAVMLLQAVAALQANASQLGIASIFYKGNGIEMFGDPTTNIRVPDIAIDVQPGARAVLQGHWRADAGFRAPMTWTVREVAFGEAASAA